MYKIVYQLFVLFTSISLFIFILSMITNDFSKKESFEVENECAKIAEGECNSKLCPSNCKIQHSSKTNKCYCIERK